MPVDAPALEERFMQKTIAAMILALAAVPALAGQQAAEAPKAEAAAKLSADSPIETVAANAGGKAVLDREMPTLLSHPMYDAFKSMSLRQVQPMSGGAISAEVVDKVDALLKALP